MRKPLEYIFIFFAYVLISIILIYALKSVTTLGWFIASFIGLTSVSFYLLKNYSWIFKIGLSIILSAVVTIITAILNNCIFKPDSNDHYSTDYRAIFAAVAPKNESGEPDLQLIEQISFFFIAYILLLLLIYLVKKVKIAAVWEWSKKRLI